MIEIYPDSRGIYAVQPASRDAMNPTPDIHQQMSHLTRQLASLQATIATIHSRRHRSMSRRRSLSRHRHRSRKRAAGMCWYHSNYGEKARRCTKPCNFTTSKSDHQGNEVARQ
ncbi:unnamed protein product [Schistosoma intercalatum]|nr:unnamed protein product [Schistosoma intercalatum]